LRFDHLQSQFFQTVPTPVQLSRIDNLFNYNEGLVYKPKENGSIYANYGTSFNPSAENFSLISGTTSIANLKPEKNTIYEVGTKWDLFKKRLSTAFAIFRMEKQNARETVGNTVLLSGDQVVNGFQSQISGSITEIWKITAGYTYLDGKVTKSLINPTFVNRSLQNVPEHSFNLFTTYKLLPKLEVGGGMNFVSKRYASTTLVDPGNGLPRKAPGYVTFNAMAKYPLNKNITMQLNVNNLLNAKYDDQLHPNHVVPGERRVILLTTNVKF
jgi:catecholate siderophore receptor